MPSLLQILNTGSADRRTELPVDIDLAMGAMHERTEGRIEATLPEHPLNLNVDLATLGAAFEHVISSAPLPSDVRTTDVILGGVGGRVPPSALRGRGGALMRSPALAREARLSLEEGSQ